MGCFPLFALLFTFYSVHDYLQIGELFPNLPEVAVRHVYHIRDITDSIFQGGNVSGKTLKGQHLESKPKN